MLRIFFFSCLVLVLPFSGFSQAEQIFGQAEKKAVPQFDRQSENLESGQFRILLHMGFGESNIINFLDIIKVFSGSIESIRLYYSDFPKGRNFDALNLARIQTLLDNTDLYQPEKINWQIIRQTNCRNLAEAEQLFHGFEVILKAPEDLELAKLNVDSTFRDYVVEEVLERNEWKDMLIVSDMTGSMAPYIGQLFLWLKLNTLDDRIKQFVFFNDGDTQLNETKSIGSTGGIYETRSKTYEEVEELAIRCMMSGDGGDLQENDIEALLTGMDLCPDCAEHILIADNNSPMRDYELIRKLNKPIRIIICGVQTKVNIEYLNLARQTGGSVHLIERDLYHLTKINEGETLEIGPQKYIIRQNKFVEVKKI